MLLFYVLRERCIPIYASEKEFFDVIPLRPTLRERVFQPFPALDKVYDARSKSKMK